MTGGAVWIHHVPDNGENDYVRDDSAPCEDTLPLLSVRDVAVAFHLWRASSEVDRLWINRCIRMALQPDPC